MENIKENIIEIKNLQKSFGNNHVLKDITLDIKKGEVVTIIGSSGSGKSTLVSHLNGLLKPSDGTILIENEDIWEKPKEIRKIRSSGEKQLTF